MLLRYQDISGLLDRQLISAKFSQRFVDVGDTVNVHSDNARALSLSKKSQVSYDFGKHCFFIICLRSR